MLICPSYLRPEADDFKLTLFRIKGNQKFVQLEHRDILGALLHIGLKREKFGDILLNEGECQTIVASEVADFVTMQVAPLAESQPLQPERMYPVAGIAVSWTLVPERYGWLQVPPLQAMSGRTSEWTTPLPLVVSSRG